MKKQIGKYAKVSLATAVITALIMTAVVLLIFGGVDNFRSSLKFSAILSLLENNYIDDTDMQAATDSAYAALVRSAADKWSYYMNAEQLKSYESYGANTYTGIGVTVRAEDQGFLIIEIAADTPAERAGLAAGDTIISVDGEEMSGKEISYLKSLIEQKRGGDITLGILYADGSQGAVALVSESIYSNPVRYELLEDNIGYIEIKNFESGCAQEAISAIESLIEAGAQSLIFDMRNNPGGKVAQLVELLDYLLPEGDIFISVARNGREEVQTSDAKCVELPMAVLINSNTYSAAEFFAAALSEYEAGVTVGEATTGKGRSQATYTLFDGSAVHLSTKKYLTPQRRDLSEEGGIAPDVEVMLDKDSEIALQNRTLGRSDDLQLAAAVEYLR